MAWATPVIHATGDIVTASDWNINSNDISFLGGSAGTYIGTQQTTTSTTYTDLTTAGPAVTLTTGIRAIVIVTAFASNNTTADTAWMSYAVSGATTNAASDVIGAAFQAYTANAAGTVSAVFVQNLNAGSNTFTAKYRASAGTASFASRAVTVIPLP